jgi:hypothetical protein
MNQEAIQNIDPDSVQIVTVTENHEDGKLADQHRLRHANLENNVLTLEVGEIHPLDISHQKKAH